ncbi:hypothetical protein GF323_02955 [Candidatus Woesearchaeota archaeon]|nr:hypothetical protein [Candidatus Woesearchaeota archaeon]
MKIWLLVGILAALLFAACSQEITSFEECVAAGNPVLESYPRQCRADGKMFIEEIGQNIMYHICTEEEKQAEACTMEHDPVCAMVDNDIRCITAPCPSMDAITFSNSCSACSGQAHGYYDGECNANLFVVCRETETGFDSEKYTNDEGGICVEVCPGNYDAFTTQTGIELCIEHYGKEEIEQWQTCGSSTENCECARAYETTTGEQIEDSEYRCVPEMYAERLLFRAGLDGLDENGERSVVIA